MTLYLGLNFKTALTEGPLKPLFPPQPEAAGPVLEDWTCAAVVATKPLLLLDLWTSGMPRTNALPGEAVGPSRTDHTASQRYAAAVYAHGDQVDGILYPSHRLTFAPLFNGTGACLAIFDRAIPKLKAVTVKPLPDWKPHLAAALQDLGI